MKEHTKDKRALLVIILGAAVLMLIIAASAFTLHNGDSQQSSLSSSQSETDDAEGSSDEAANSNELMLESFAQYHFYEEDRSERYLNYQEVHPELTSEQVVLSVNVDLDIPAYEDTTTIADPSAMYALITKHFGIPYEYEPDGLVEFGIITIKSEVVGSLERLLADAAADGVSLSPSSGYRSAATQEYLYNEYAATLGTEWADAQSAHAGFSEHQTGWAIDFSPADYTFYDTPQAYWLTENAYRYGFIVRYTDENTEMTQYINEPWHVRYVGTEVSNFMHTNGIDSFEEYWVKYVQSVPESSSG